MTAAKFGPPRHKHEGRYPQARDAIAKPETTIIGGHVVGVDHAGKLCKLINGRWRRLVPEARRRLGLVTRPRKRYSGHPLTAPGVP